MLSLRSTYSFTRLEEDIEGLFLKDCVYKVNFYDYFEECDLLALYIHGNGVDIDCVYSFEQFFREFELSEEVD